MKKKAEEQTTPVYVEKRTGHVIGSKYDAAAGERDEWARTGNCENCRREKYCTKECRAAKDRRLLQDKRDKLIAEAKAGIFRKH